MHPITLKVVSVVNFPGVCGFIVGGVRSEGGWGSILPPPWTDQ